MEDEVAEGDEEESPECESVAQDAGGRREEVRGPDSWRAEALDPCVRRRAQDAQRQALRTVASGPGLAEALQEHCASFFSRSDGDPGQV